MKTEAALRLPRRAAPDTGLGRGRPRPEPVRLIASWRKVTPGRRSARRTRPGEPILGWIDSLFSGCVMVGSVSRWLTLPLFVAAQLSGPSAMADTVYKGHTIIGNENRSAVGLDQLPLWHQVPGAEALADVNSTGAPEAYAFSLGPVASAKADVIGTITFSGPRSSVYTRTNLRLDGGLVVADPDPLAGPWSTATVHFAVSLQNQNTLQRVIIPSNWGRVTLDTKLWEPGGAAYNPAAGARIPRREGLLAGTEADNPLDFNDMRFQTGSFQVETGVPYWLQMSLSVLAEGSSAGDPAVSSFEYTFSFPPDGPAFDLPAGYTVDSNDLYIVDNRWVVPEPTMLSLLASALPLLAGRWWRRRAFAAASTNRATKRSNRLDRRPGGARAGVGCRRLA